LEYVEKANKIHNNRYSYDKTVYINAYTKVIITCNIHGDFKQRPHDHINKKQGCPKCAGKYQYTTHEFIEICKEVHNNRYNYDKTVYVNTYTKIIITCKIHGDFKQSPGNHLNRNQGCPRCYNSKGENIISNLLDISHINYKREYKFLNTDISNYRYDFYIISQNIVIEYHGIQHYKFNVHFHRNIDNYMKYWYRDIIKKEYCLNNNINYIEISYKDHDLIEKILRTNSIIY
jgi:hypothetical protein